ncbi:unnamed protein product [Trichobilharzia szidati]|nr:unnamed protein product [Trichobilharzia szidati]
MPRNPTLHRPVEVKDFEHCYHKHVLVRRFVENSNNLMGGRPNLPNGYTQRSYTKYSTVNNSASMAQKEIECIKQIERHLPLEYPCITIFYSDMETELERKIILFIARRWDRDDPFATISPLVSELELRHGNGWKFERVVNPIKVGRANSYVKPKSTFCFRLEPDQYIYKFYRDDEHHHSR